jgi:hypothetical protein
MHVYEVRPCKDHRGFDLISDVLPFGRLWYGKPDDAIGYATFYSRSHDAVIRVYDATSNVIETLLWKSRIELLLCCYNQPMDKGLSGAVKCYVIVAWKRKSRRSHAS